MAIEKDNQPTEDTLPETEATVELPGEEGGEAVVAINEDGTTQLNPEVEAESEEDFYSNLAETIDERVLMKLGTELDGRGQGRPGPARASDSPASTSD